MAERYVIGFHVTDEVELALSMRGEIQEYYRGFEGGTLPPKVLEMLRAFTWITGKATGHGYSPMLVKRFDHHPVSTDEIFDELEAGRFGISLDAKGNLKEVVMAFLEKKATFGDLREAVGLGEGAQNG